MSSEDPNPEDQHKVWHTPSGKPYMLIKTSSPVPIYLTEFYLTDASAAQSTASLPAIYLSLISIPVPYTLADAESWINLQLTGTSNLPLQVLRSGDPETGRFIGCVSLMPTGSEALRAMKEKINLAAKGHAVNECELGYYLHPDWRGKGIMRNAVRALIWWGIEEMGVEKVVVTVLEKNLESKAVVESLVEFVRVEERDQWVDWPEIKGGGRRRLMAWRWMG
ncbi:hypothetical protein D0Z07_7580 [Hyphodiscus hymeniophilus]|uniref:N-acetyltransferase domain-containing protein n=1 Tax=Hyphodiscus hymeniophilus TaxID=353542 RepID=A0A9P6VEW4_9HELO|nr:hypothetical protein D0Z07_7580 [Hyphodiscus hymeniophilus]